MKKLFVTDFDGTLATSKKEISPATRAALDAWCAAGNCFALSSGRAMSDVISLAEGLRLDLPGMFLVGYNGAEIYDCSQKKIVFHAGIDRALLPRIYELAGETGLYIQTYSDTHILSHDWDAPELAYYHTWVRLPAMRFTSPNEVFDYLDEIDLTPCKCLAITKDHPERLEQLRQKLLSEFSGVLDAFQSSETLLEIVNEKAGKGKALRALAEHLGVTISDTIASGDAPNDIPMIRDAGLGVVMCNGAAIYPEMKALGLEKGNTITAADNDHDGLLPYLKWERRAH